MSKIVDRTHEKDLKRKIEQFYKDIERIVKSNELTYRYSGPSTFGIVTRTTGMDVWEKERWITCVWDSFWYGEYSRPRSALVLSIDFDKYRLTLHLEKYRYVADALTAQLQKLKVTQLSS